MSDLVSALASFRDVVLSKAKSLRLSVSNNSAGTCLSILSPTVILEHLFTTCWLVIMWPNLEIKKPEPEPLLGWAFCCFLVF